MGTYHRDFGISFPKVYNSLNIESMIMKTYSLILIFKVLLLTVQAQDCPTGTITFSTQGQIDSFLINFPGCTSIDGIIIQETSPGNITNLHGLLGIDQVGAPASGIIMIYGNTALTNLHGLDSIKTFGGAFTRIIRILNNPILTDIHALNSVAISNPSEFTIENNPNLSACNVDFVCNYIDVFPVVNLSGNDCGCNTIEEIQWNCVPGNYLPCGITLSSQEQIDSFTINYAGCKAIGGDVIIEESIPGNITNLSGLGGFAAEIIGGELFVQNNLSLTSLSGLDSIRHIGGQGEHSLSIISNANLVNLSGLEQLRHVRSISIEDNAALTNLDGLQSWDNYLDGSLSSLFVRSNASLTSLNGLVAICKFANLDVIANPQLTNLRGLDAIEMAHRLGIHSNDGLISLQGLEALEEIGVSMSITHNAVLRNLAGLNRLKNIGFHDSTDGRGIVVNINDNDALANLSGLDSLIEMRGGLQISGNNSLTSLNGLLSLKGISGRLIISDNALLPDLDGLQGLNQMGFSSSVGTEIRIENNASLTNFTGLNNLTQILTAPDDGPEWGSLIIRNNAQLRNLIGLESLKQMDGSLIVENNPNLATLATLGISHIGGNLHIKNNDAIIDFDGLDNLITVGHGVSVIDNDLLVDFEGLNGFTSIGAGASMVISGNSSLRTLNGLESFSAIYPSPGFSGYVRIDHNPSLTNLEGLEHLDPGVHHFDIHDNTQLAYCSILNICNTIDASSATYTFYNNAAGCNSAEEVSLACNFPPEVCTWIGSTGYWTQYTNWDCSRTPLSFDTVVIPHGDVSIPINYDAACMSLNILPGAELSLPQGSTITIKP